MTDKQDTYVGLDMGGAQTRCLVAVADGPDLSYLSCGSMPPARWTESDGQESQITAESVHEVLCEAERGAGLTIMSAVVGIGGARVSSHLVHTAVALPPDRNRVQMDDVRDVVKKAERGLLSARSTLLQLVPLKFVAGTCDGLRNPVGYQAKRLEAFVRVIATHEEEHAAANSLVKDAGIRVEETILDGFAAAYGTLEPAELAAGVAHLEFGKTASSLTAYCHGGLRLATGLPIGRDDLVADLARAFDTNASIASSLISDFGRVEFDTGDDSKFVFVPGPDSDPVGSGAMRSCRLLNKIITRRVDDCLQLARAELLQVGIGDGGVRSLVLTGDVAALPGMRTMARVVVGLRTRIGVPSRPQNLPAALRHPGWACAAGLVLYAHRLAYRPSTESGGQQALAGSALQQQEKAA